MRKQVVKTMQERGIKELPMFKSYQEWGKEQDYKPDDYEEDESDDEGYLNYRDGEAPYAIFFDKYGYGYDYRVDKVTLKQNGTGAPVLEFDCYANEIGSDTFGENDFVFLTLYNVYDTMLDLLGIEDEPKESFEITSVSREDLETAGFDASDVDDDTMERLADKMGDAYVSNGFWIDLPIIAEYLEIPKKGETEEEEE
jgi:hypothetical protein